MRRGTGGSQMDARYRWRRNGRRGALPSLVVAAGLGLLLMPGAASAGDGRVFEQVTPADAGGYQVELDVVGGNGFWANVSPDGNHVYWTSSGDIPYAPPDGGAAVHGFDIVFSNRQSDGRWLPAGMSRYEDMGYENSAGAQLVAGSPDGSRALYASSDSVLPGVPADPYTSRLVIEDADGRRQMVSRGPNGELGSVATGLRLRNDSAATPDIRTVVFNTDDPLVPEDTNALHDVYLWRDGSPLQLITGRSPDPDMPLEASMHGRLGNAGGAQPGYSAAEAGAISQDGSTVFFTMTSSPSSAGGAANTAYVWRNGTVRRIGPGPGRFIGASKDGAYAFYTTNATSSNATISNVWRYDVANDTSVEVVSAVGTRVVARTPDGSQLFFVTSQALVAEDTDASESLYRWSAGGGWSYISQYAVSDLPPATFGFAWAPVRVSNDGEVVAFTSRLPLAGDAVAGVPDAFVHADGQLTRISAGGDESIAASIANLTMNNGTSGRGVTVDGSRVYFSTARRLDPADVNSTTDVYEWSGDQARLISPGNAERDAQYVDNSDDGSSVFFTTTQELYDDFGGRPFIYVARIGGIAPVVAPPPVSVPAGPSVAGSVATPPTAESGPVEPPASSPPAADAAERPSAAPAQVGLAHRTVSVAGRRAAFRLRVPEAGRLEAQLKSRRGAKTLGRGAATVDAGNVTLKVRLSRKAVRRVRSDRRLKARLVLRLTVDDGSVVKRTLRVSLARQRGAGNGVGRADREAVR